MDAAWAVRQRDPGFWPALRARLARIDPNVILIAEASGRDGYYVTHGFGAAYDWTSRLGQWAWDGVFASADGVPDLDRLRAALTDGGQGYPAHTLLLRFLDNNDTGKRFITRYGVGEMRVAIELEFTLPGIPLIYDGDEALIALNFDRAPVRVRLRNTPALADFSRASAQDLATGRRWQVDLRDQALTLPAYGGAIVLSGLRSRAAGAH